MTGPPGREPVVNMDEFSAHKVETAIKLDARRTAVLVVDMLNDFCKPGGAMVLPGYERLIGLTGGNQRGSAVRRCGRLHRRQPPPERAPGHRVSEADAALHRGLVGRAGDR